MKSTRIWKAVRWWRIAAAAVICLCCVTACSDIRGIQQEKAAKEYLSGKYEGEFEVKAVLEGEGGYIEAYPAAYPEIVFRVEEKEPSKLSGDAFRDNYPEQFLLKTAERLGLSMEEMENSRSYRTSYADYGDIEGTAGKVAELASLCRETNAFGGLSDWTLTVIPAFATGESFPGCRISLSGMSIGAFEQESLYRVSDEELNEKDLGLKLKRCHLVSYYNYAISETDPAFPQEDLDWYREYVTGAMETAVDGSRLSFPYVDLGDSGERIDIGEAYRILKAEGLVVETGTDYFTASGDGLTATFNADFSDTEPRYSWLVDGDADEEREEDGDSNMPYISRTLIEEMTGKELTATTEEKILKRMADWRGKAVAAGQPVTLGPYELTVTSVEITKRVEDSSFYYTPDEGMIFLGIHLKTVNHGTERSDMFPMVLTSETDCAGYVYDAEGRRYIPGSMMGHVYGNVEAGETMEDIVYFQIPADKSEDLSGYLLSLYNGADGRAYTELVQ